MTSLNLLAVAALLTSLVAARPALAAPERFESQLTVYALPAPRPAGLSWKTPGGLARRVLVDEAGAKLGLFTHAIGHQAIHVQCAASAGAPAAEWKGSMYEANPSEFSQAAIRDGWGLLILFKTFSGRFQTPAELDHDLEERLANGRIAFVRFGLSSGGCRRILAFIRGFEERKANLKYGLAARPRHAEGGGCSAFSMSAVEVAGVMEPAFKAGWSFNVNVPEALIGAPPTKKVSLLAIADDIRPWAAPIEPHRPLFGWDPTLAFEWIVDAVGRAAKGQKVLQEAVSIERRGKAVGLVVDRRSAPVPTDPLFFK